MNKRITGAVLAAALAAGLCAPAQAIAAAPGAAVCMTAAAALQPGGQHGGSGRSGQHAGLF